MRDSDGADPPLNAACAGGHVDPAAPPPVPQEREDAPVAPAPPAPEPGRGSFLFGAAVAAVTAAAAANAVLNAWIDPAPDFRFHAIFAGESWRDGAMAAPHPLWQWSINGLAALAGRGGDPSALHAAGALVLAAAAAARTVLFDRIFVLLARAAGGPAPTPAVRAAAALFLGIAAAAPNWWNFPRIGLGQFSANVWHNPTLALMSPFAAAAVLCALRGAAGAPRAWVWGGVWLGVSALAKPSAAVVILPVAAAATLLRRIALRDAIAFALPAAAAIAWIMVRIADHPLNKGVAFAPFLVWNYYTRLLGPGGEPLGPAHKIESLMVSYAFPAAAAVLLPRPERLRGWIFAAWAAVAAALLQLALLAERGGRWSHGNFLWGVYAATAFLFVVTCAQWAAACAAARGVAGWRHAALACAAAAHAAGGVIQFARALLGRDAQA